MDERGRTRKPDAPEETRPFEEVVPARVVLTELARGFLLTQPGDPESAKRFAVSFLREQTGRSPPARLVSIPRQPAVRRGVEKTATDRWGRRPG